MARRLISFWAGGRARKKVKEAVTMREPMDAGQTASQQATGAFKKGGKVDRFPEIAETKPFKKGGKVKVVVKKAAGGMPGAVAGAKHRASMAMTNPMDGRLDTGVVGRRPKRAMPTMGTAMGALGPIR